MTSFWKKEFIELLKLPTVITKNGIISKLNYRNENNKLHRNQLVGPAVIVYYYEHGWICYTYYYNNGIRHRSLKEGPAFTNYYEGGNICFESYYVNGKMHRPIEEGPASINYTYKGIVWYEQYYINGNMCYQINKKLNF